MNFLFNLVLPVYSKMFVIYYKIIPRLFQIINNYIIKNINCIFVPKFLPINIPLLESNLTCETTEEEVYELIDNRDRDVMMFIYIEMIVSALSSVFFVFSDTGLNLIRTSLVLYYPLRETIFSITNTESKNLWLSYWLFYIIYENVYVLNSFELYMFEVFELCMMYLLVRYDFLKRTLYESFLYVNENRDIGYAELLNEIMKKITCKIRKIILNIKKLD